MAHDYYILCIDDEQDDCDLVAEAIQNNSPSLGVVYVSSGDLAIQYLQQRFETPPSMIMLDINSPVNGGIQCFFEIKEMLGINCCPMIMLVTVAPRSVDVEFAQQNGLIIRQKPTSVQGYDELAKDILELLEKRETG